jgi:predicted DNA-binding transcriptional regulator YafY
MNKNIRLLSILEKLSSQEKVCVKELVIYLDEERRNIQSDFKDVLNPYFGDRLNYEKGCYFLLKKEYFHDLFQHNHKTSKQFLKFLSIVDSDLYNQFKKEHSELIKALKLDSSAVYQIENSPYEHLKFESLEVLEKLESAIINRTNITITHHRPNEKVWIFKECHVLKILYLEDNWYITVNTMQNYHKKNPKSCFRLMRISFIKKITLSRVEPKTFHSDNSEKLHAEKFIHLLQTPFSKIHNTPYRVIVKISAYASVYFKAKKYLKSQRTIKNLDDGCTYIEFTITDDMEIIPLIKQWLPHLRVIEPLIIREKVKKEILQFMKEE